MQNNKEENNKEEKVVPMLILFPEGVSLVSVPDAKEFIVHSFGAYLKDKYPMLAWKILDPMPISSIHDEIKKNLSKARQ